VVNDPLKKLGQAALGVDRTSAALRAAQGVLQGSDIFERMARDQRRFDEMLGLRPDIFRDIARQQQAFSDLLARRPTIFEDMARKQSEFEMLVSGGGLAAATDRLASVEQATASARRLAGVLEHQKAFERLINGRSILPDHVVDVLALRAPVNSLVEHLSGHPSRIGDRFAKQMEEASRFIAEATGTLPSRDVLSGRFPDIVPPLRLPTRSEIAGIDLVAASGVRNLDRAWREATAAQIATIETPWVRDDRPDLSLEGFAALKGLTEIVSSAEPSAPRVTRMVRAEFGDYRREDSADDELEDPVLVSGLRFARGFDARLASLPMALAGSVFAPFGMVVGPPPEADPDELDEAIVLMIRPLERTLRAFIDARMKAAVGERWIRQRVHKNIRDEWEKRRQADADAKRPTGDLLDYADFAHYRAIIEQADNWREAFQPVFKVKTSIGETLARLSVIRNPVAHVRPLSIEDLLVLRVEGQRLYRWIGERVP